MKKAWSLALWSVLVCRIAIITDNSKGDGTGAVPRQKGRSKWKSRRTIWSEGLKGWTMSSTIKLYEHNQNGNLTPSDIVAGSAKRVWWKCQKCGGEWQAPPVKRKIGKGSCPYCAGRKLKKGVNDLASQYPEVALDYLPELNGGIPADEVIVKYGTKVIWKCHVCGHEWKNDVYDRTRAPKPSGCVKCQRRTASGRFRQMAIEKTGALADTNPNLAAA